MEKKNILTKSLKGLLGILILTAFMIAMPKQVKAATPVQIGTSWVKMGSYQVRLADSKLYIRKSGKTVKTISNVYKAIGNANTIFYGVAYTKRESIYAYGLKTKNAKKLWTSSSNNLLGYYNGYVYFSNSSTYARYYAYKMNIKTGKVTGISSLKQVVGSMQYKNYIILMNFRGDPSPTTFRIYNMSTGKVVKTVSSCSSGKIIGGKVYYSVLKFGKGESDSLQTVYCCNLNGTGTKRIAQFKGNYMPPALGSTYGYFYKTYNTIVKYYYSSKKTVKSSYSELSSFGRGVW